MDILVKIPELGERLEIPSLTPILPLIISIHLYLSNSNKLLNFLLLPLLFYFTIISPIFYTTKNKAGDFGLGSQGIFTFLNIIDKLLLSNLEFDFLRNEEKIVPEAWTLERLVWSIKLYATMRGPGWKWEVKNIPKSSSIDHSTKSSTKSTKNSRFQFCFQRLLSALIYYVSMDLISTGYMRNQPYFHRNLSFSEIPLVERYFNMLTGGIAGFLALALLYELVVIISVASTFWSIEECPPLFGKLSDSYSIRGFWSKTWHQGLRRTFSRPGIILSNSLQLSPTSISRKIIIISTTFSLSALQHSFAAYTMDRKGLGSGVFFLLQPFGIFLESLICYFGRFLGLRRSRGVIILGYFWTASWLLCCSPWFIDELVQAGMWELNPAPLTLIGYIKNGVYWNPN